MELCSNDLGILNNKYILALEIIIDILYKVVDSFTDKIYIVKTFDKYDISIQKEIQINTIISESNNPSFVRYIDYSYGPLIRDITENKHYIVFENASKGGLSKYININRNGFPEKVCKYIFYKILKAIQFLHNLGISHRNIKIDNILLDGENYDIKIWDLSSETFFINEKGKRKLLNQGITISNYTAPEISMRIPYDGEKTDIYSLGVLLFMLRTGKEVNINNILSKNGKLFKLINNKKSDIVEKAFGISELSQDFKKLYFKHVAFNPKQRPTIEEIFNYDWIKEMNNEEVLKRNEVEMINELKKRESYII